MKPTKVINQPKPTPLPTATSGFPSCGLNLTQENTYTYKTIFHFYPVPGAVDYAAFQDYSDPVNANQLTYYNPAFPNQLEISATKLPLQNHEYTFDLVAYTQTSVICVQKVTFITHYLT